MSVPLPISQSQQETSSQQKQQNPFSNRSLFNPNVFSQNQNQNEHQNQGSGNLRIGIYV